LKLPEEAPDMTTEPHSLQISLTHVDGIPLDHAAAKLRAASEAATKAGKPFGDEIISIGWTMFAAGVQNALDAVAKTLRDDMTLPLKALEDTLSHHPKNVAQILRPVIEHLRRRNHGPAARQEKAQHRYEVVKKYRDQGLTFKQIRTRMSQSNDDRWLVEVNKTGKLMTDKQLAADFRKRDRNSRNCNSR
jgi:hypothetical protein